MSFIDGEKGILVFRGYRIEDPAANATYPETAYLLLYGTLPNSRQLDECEERGKTETQPNVDFYSASVYHLLGIPPELMTPVFAVSRVAGWSAHIVEEKTGEAQVKPALYRPKVEYTGQFVVRWDVRLNPLVGISKGIIGTTALGLSDTGRYGFFCIGSTPLSRPFFCFVDLHCCYDTSGQEP